MDGEEADAVVVIMDVSLVLGLLVGCEVGREFGGLLDTDRICWIVDLLVVRELDGIFRKQK